MHQESLHRDLSWLQLLFLKTENVCGTERAVTASTFRLFYQRQTAVFYQAPDLLI